MKAEYSDVFNLVKDALIENGYEAEALTDDTNLERDLGVDSLGKMDLGCSVECGLKKKFAIEAGLAPLSNKVDQTVKQYVEEILAL